MTCWELNEMVDIHIHPCVLQYGYVDRGRGRGIGTIPPCHVKMHALKIKPKKLKTNPNQTKRNQNPLRLTCCSFLRHDRLSVLLIYFVKEETDLDLGITDLSKYACKSRKTWNKLTSSLISLVSYFWMVAAERKGEEHFFFLRQKKRGKWYTYKGR